MKLNLDKLIKKEILITSAVVLFLSLLFIGFTRAIYKTTSEGQTNNVVYGNLEIQLCTDTSCANIASNLGNIVGMTDNISFTSNMYPKTEAEAMLGTPYSFVVKNVGQYDAYVDLISEYDWTEENPGSSLVTNYSGVMIAYKKAEDINHQIKKLNQFTIASQLFKNVFIASGESQIFNVWVWAGEEASNEIIDRILITKIKVSGYYIPDDPNNLHDDLDNSLVNEETDHVNFGYTGNFQEFIAPKTGIYQIELWGAGAPQIGIANTEGKGAYTRGMIELEEREKLYIYVGQSNTSGGPNSEIDSFNGGGHGSAEGGGATDIRLVAGNWDDPYSLNSRIMVAGGGGGAVHTNSSPYIAVTDSPGHGGGIIGINANFNAQDPCGYGGYDFSGHGGTQISGGAPGTSFAGSIDPVQTLEMTGIFGIGGYSIPATNGSLYESSGGGGGYYGGGHGNHTGCTWTGGGGGSSFISGHEGCIAINAENDINNPRIIKSGCTSASTSVACSTHYSGKIFTDTKMIDGAGYAWTTIKSIKEPMPNPNSGFYSLGVGHAGNGYARITYIPSLIQHTIVFDLNGGTQSLNYTGLYYEGEQYYVENPIYSGYDFNGWTISSETTSIVNGIMTVGNQNANITATWQYKPNLELVYETNVSIDISSLLENYSPYSQITLPTPTRNGYKFNGWRLTGGTETGAILVGNNLTFGTGDVEVTATWQLATYSITYNLKNGTATNPTTFNVTSASFTLNNPTRSGCTFTGWTGSNGSVASTTVTISTGSYGNKSYVAHWKCITNYTYANQNTRYTVTLYAGSHQIELWGAGGENAGKGGYTSGKINLTSSKSFYIYVGSESSGQTSGYNGGGIGGTDAIGSSNGFGGAGATDIRYGGAEYANRIMVAAGGGGKNGSASSAGYCGGGLSDCSGNTTQTAGNSLGSGGLGATSHWNGISYYGQSYAWIDAAGGGGGGGLYGGIGGDHIGGSGGSSYISGHNGCVAHSSGISFSSTVMIDGANYNWTTARTGIVSYPANAGYPNGHARITTIY